MRKACVTLSAHPRPFPGITFCLSYLCEKKRFLSSLLELLERREGTEMSGEIVKSESFSPASMCVCMLLNSGLAMWDAGRPAWVCDDGSSRKGKRRWESEPHTKWESQDEDEESESRSPDLDALVFKKSDHDLALSLLSFPPLPIFLTLMCYFLV